MVASHPIGTLIERNEFKKAYVNLQYDFQKRFAGLILRCFKPEAGLMENLTQINSFFSKEYWQDSEKLEKLMIHAETLCQALSMLETIKVLGKQASKDPSRKELFKRFVILAKPRFEAIFQDWELR